MLIGSLGTGQIPVLQNPVAGTRVLSLPSRMWSTSLTLTVAGTIMLVLAWLLIGRFAVGRLSVEVLAGRSPARRMTRKQADRTLLLWSILWRWRPDHQQGRLFLPGAERNRPSRHGPLRRQPAERAGVDHVLTRSVPNLWRDTPAPYGPFFLWIGEGITAITGNNITAAVFLHRLVALLGIALIVWALPRLARRCGCPVSRPSGSAP